MDTPALLGRDISIFPKVLEVLQLAKPMTNSKKGSFKVLYPQDFIPEDSPQQVHAMKAFIQDISNFGDCTLHRISIANDWQKTAPVEEKDLRKYFFNVRQAQNCAYQGTDTSLQLTHHSWFYTANHSFKDFRQQYLATNGHEPFVTEAIRWYW